MKYSTSFTVNTDQNSTWNRVCAFFSSHEFKRSGSFFERGVPGFSMSERPEKRQCLAFINSVPNSREKIVSIELYTDDNYCKPLKMEQKYWHELIEDFTVYISGETESIPTRAQETLQKTCQSYGLIFIAGLFLVPILFMVGFFPIFIFFDNQSNLILFPILSYLFSLLFLVSIYFFKWYQKSRTWLNDTKRDILHLQRAATDLAYPSEDSEISLIYISYGMFVAFTLKQFSQKFLVIKSTADLVGIIVLNLLAVLYLLYLCYVISIQVSSQNIERSWQYYLGVIALLFLFEGLIWLQKSLRLYFKGWRLNVAQVMVTVGNISAILLSGWGLSSLFGFSKDTYFMYFLAFPVLSSVIYWTIILGNNIVRRLKKV